MSEPRESSSQEQEVNIVEKFRKILDRKPEQNYWLGGAGELRESEEDRIAILYEEGDSLRSIPLEREEKTFITKLFLGMPHIKFGRFFELSSHPVEKTTAEQLRGIVEEKGEPTSIYYRRCETNHVEGEENIFEDIFPFSEIKKDLGL